MSRWACHIDLSFSEQADHVAARSAIHVAQASVVFREPKLEGDSPEACLQSMTGGPRTVRILVVWRLRIGYGLHCEPEVVAAAKRTPSKHDDKLDEFVWALDDPAVIGDLPEKERTTLELSQGMVPTLTSCTDHEDVGFCAREICGLGPDALDDQVAAELESILREALPDATTEDLGLAEQNYLEAVLAERLGDAADTVLENIGQNLPLGCWNFEVSRTWLEEIADMLSNEEVIVGDLNVYGSYEYVHDDYGTPEDTKAEYGEDDLGRWMVRYGEDDAVEGPFEDKRSAQRRAQQHADERHVGEPGETAADMARRMKDEAGDTEDWDDEGSDWR
jgi:hypothetical protein